MKTDQRVLVLDIETAPMTAYVWGRREQNIAINQIKNDWYVLAWSAKWLGDPASKIIYRDQRHSKNLENDTNLLSELWTLLDEAEIVLTQNGKNFDIPKLFARFILQGRKPPSPFTHLDTYQIARRIAQFTSNSLDYLSHQLCTTHKKLKHRKFPGMALWNACLSGNQEAWKEMERYNIQDTLATEELYLKLRAWAPTTAPKPYHEHPSQTKCTTCGETTVIKNGFRTNQATTYQRYICRNCGKWTLQKLPRVKTNAS